MDSAPEPNKWPRFRTLLCLFLFTLYYFTDACLRASEKFFWFDELCSLYISRLPTFGQSWEAVLHGADYNPPLFYVITRLIHRTLGDGLVAARLPAMLGIWVFCLCMFVVVGRRVGTAAGFVALLFPLTTIAAYYSSEARPHGIVLGFIGAAIVCWCQLLQHPVEQPGHKRWLFGLSLSLAGAFFTHCYAVVSLAPFLMVELWIVIRTRRIRWTLWASMLIPAVAACVSFVPLLHAYKANLAGTGFAYQFRSGLWQLPYFYAHILTPSILTLVAAVVVLGAMSAVGKKLGSESALAIAFVVLPVVAIAFSLAIRGPFISRYFLSTVSGFAILLGLAAGRTVSSTRWPAVLLLGVLVATLGKSFVALLWHHGHGQGEALMEPALNIPMNTTPGKPLARFTKLLSETGSSLPIVMAEPMDYLYLVHYAPQLVPRLYYVTWSDDETNYRLYRNVREWCHINFNPVSTYTRFLPNHPEFYLWGDPLNLSRLGELTAHGARIQHWDGSPDFFLARVQMNKEMALKNLNGSK